MYDVADCYSKSELARMGEIPRSNRIVNRVTTCFNRYIRNVPNGWDLLNDLEKGADKGTIGNIHATVLNLLTDFYTDVVDIIQGEIT